MLVATAVSEMIGFYQGNLHDTAHFVKVWGYARTIGQLEGLDAKTQQTLELAAVVHDIAIPLCREKYGSTAGPLQEREGSPLAEAFFSELGLEQEQLQRICYLVGHHHSLNEVEGMDYQILLEADFLVNADEGQMSKEVIRNFRDKVFRTQTGKKLLNELYRL